MKEFKEQILKAIVEEAENSRIVNFREVCNHLGISHVSRADISDILVAIEKRGSLPGYTSKLFVADPEQKSPAESLFTTLNFVANEVEFETEPEFVERTETPQERYDAAHTKQLKLKLNTTTDADILEKLDSVESKQGYIKRLIREDLKK